MTHIQIRQDDQGTWGKSHETTLGQSDPNAVSSTSDHVGPTMGGVWQEVINIQELDTRKKARDKSSTVHGIGGFQLGVCRDEMLLEFIAEVWPDSKVNCRLCQCFFLDVCHDSTILFSLLCLPFFFLVYFTLSHVTLLSHGSHVQSHDGSPDLSHDKGTWSVTWPWTIFTSHMSHHDSLLCVSSILSLWLTLPKSLTPLEATTSLTHTATSYPTVWCHCICVLTYS